MATHSCEAECAVHLKVKVILKLSHTECNMSKRNIIATYVICHHHLKCSCDWQSVKLTVYYHQRLGRHLLHKNFCSLTNIWQRTKIEQKRQIELKFGQVNDSSMPYAGFVQQLIYDYYHKRAHVAVHSSMCVLLTNAYTHGTMYMCVSIAQYKHGRMYCHVCADQCLHLCHPTKIGQTWTQGWSLQVNVGLLTLLCSSLLEICWQSKCQICQKFCPIFVSMVPKCQVC